MPRKRIGLTMRKDGGGRAEPGSERSAPAKPGPRGPMAARPKDAPKGGDMGGLGAALLDAMKRR